MCFTAAHLYNDNFPQKAHTQHHFPWIPTLTLKCPAPLNKGKTTRSSAQTYPKVKAVERRVEVIPWPQPIHLQRHLSKKQTQKNELCKICEQEKRLN